MTDFKNTPELSESTETAIAYSRCYIQFCDKEPTSLSIRKEERCNLYMGIAWRK
jgi:hypothetical protein